MTYCSVTRLAVIGRDAEAIPGGFRLRFRLLDARPLSKDLLIHASELDRPFSASKDCNRRWRHSLVCGRLFLGEAQLEAGDQRDARVTLEAVQAAALGQYGPSHVLTPALRCRHHRHPRR